MPTKNRPATAPGASGNGNTLRIHSSIARDLGRKIVSGRYPPGHILKGEIEASEQLNISRTAYREAIRILAAKGLVVSRPKLGTRITPRQDWHLLDPDVLAWICDGKPDPELLASLFELRMIVEPSAAALAAERRANTDLEEMADALDVMRQHTLHSGIGRAADQRFHATLLRATGNPFLVSLTKGVTAAVETLTALKVREGMLNRDAVPDHERVYEAIAAQKTERARRAMSDLIRLAREDTRIQPRQRDLSRVRNSKRL